MIVPDESDALGRGAFRERTARAPFLPIYFALQSYFRSRWELRGAFTLAARRQRRTLLAWATLCAFALALWSAGCDALALGLAFPGAGFLYWAGGAQAAWAVALFVASLAAFGSALAIWFATGNVVLPPAIWLCAAGVAARPDWAALDPRLTCPIASGGIPIVLVTALLARAMIAPRLTPATPPGRAGCVACAAVAHARRDRA